MEHPEKKRRIRRESSRWKGREVDGEVGKGKELVAKKDEEKKGRCRVGRMRSGEEKRRCRWSSGMEYQRSA